MIHRHITHQVREALADTPAVLVNGARQTGKSALDQSAELGEQHRQYRADNAYIPGAVIPIRWATLADG